MKKILLIAGHGVSASGGYDPGAVSNGAEEHVVVQKIVSDVERLVGGKGVVIETITGGKKLSEKIRHANTYAYDLLIELHMDAASVSASGATTFYYAGSEYARKEATKFHNAYIKSIGIKDRGVKPDTQTQHGRLGIIRDTKPLAFLLETGFITNINDLNLVRDKAAQAVADAIITYFDIQPVKNQIFKDVNENHPYFNAANWAKEIGLVAGYPDGRLGIDEQLTMGRVLELFRKFYFLLKSGK